MVLGSVSLGSRRADGLHLSYAATDRLNLPLEKVKLFFSFA